jgi:hypothetical protein
MSVVQRGFCGLTICAIASLLVACATPMTSTAPGQPVPDQRLLARHGSPNSPEATIVVNNEGSATTYRGLFTQPPAR